MQKRSVWLLFWVYLIALIPTTQAQEKGYAPLTQALVSKGFKKCAQDLDRVVKWVHKDDRNAYVTVWSRTQPDQRTAFATTSHGYADGSSMVTTFTASPDAADKCSISSAQVFTSADSCASLRETTFKEWKYLLDMGTTTAYERPLEQEVTVFLTPTRSGGCIAVKQAIFYN